VPWNDFSSYSREQTNKVLTLAFHSNAINQNDEKVRKVNKSSIHSPFDVTFHILRPLCVRSNHVHLLQVRAKQMSKRESEWERWRKQFICAINFYVIIRRTIDNRRKNCEEEEDEQQQKR
jgi:hypothetical protein